jgi:putative Mg2+ transporter-C (MgtC) family protein
MNVIDIHPLSWEALLCCFLSGLAVGLERQLRGKPVGIRTNSLVCIGTYIFVAMAQHVSTEVTDPSRIIGQVVTGIGFLGAGVILARHGAVVGVTSASAIWVLAAIGVVIGLGFPWLGVKLAVLTVLILVGVDIAERRFEAAERRVQHKIRRRFGREEAEPPKDFPDAQ